MTPFTAPQIPTPYFSCVTPCPAIKVQLLLLPLPILWHKPCILSTQCPLLTVTEKCWVVSSQYFLGAMKCDHLILATNLESGHVVQLKGNYWNDKNNHSIAQYNRSLYIHCCYLRYLILLCMSSSKPRVISWINYMIIGNSRK